MVVSTTQCFWSVQIWSAWILAGILCSLLTKKVSRWIIMIREEPFAVSRVLYTGGVSLEGQDIVRQKQLAKAKRAYHLEIRVF